MIAAKTGAASSRIDRTSNGSTQPPKISPPILDDLLWEKGREDPDDEVGRPAAEVTEQVRGEVWPVDVLTETVKCAGDPDVVRQRRMRHVVVVRGEAAGRREVVQVEQT